MKVMGLGIFIMTVLMIGTAFAGSAIPIKENVNPEFVAHNEIQDIDMVVGEGEATGQIPDTIDFSYLKDTNEIISPNSYVSYFDLRNQGKVTSIKDQGSCGSCWAFASYASLESTLMPGQNLDFSEQNMKNLHGFDIDSCSGGNAQMATAYLARWSGPVLESTDPYNLATTSSPSASPVEHVQEAIFLPMKKSDLDNDAIKWALQQYGAVYASMIWSASSYNPANYSYYYTGSSTSGKHAVTIVGWDDNFDRKKFSPAATGNGAFIVKNSWGNSWGDNGYFYISYYDSSFAKKSINTVFTAESITNYDNIYQYDPLGWFSSIGYGDSVAWGANVFTAQSQEALDAVSFYTTDTQTSYEVSIYTDPVSGPLGNLKSTVSGSFDYPGYHTVALDNHVNITTGQKFSVVVKITTSGYAYPLAMEYYYSGYSSHATSNAGESYISHSGTAWTDFKDVTSYPQANLCIKAFTNENINRPPVLVSIGNKTVDMNSLLSFTISATDPDGDKLTYSATGLPSGAQLNATTGKFTWTPTNAGKYSVKFIATANGQTDNETILINVTSVNKPPVLASIGNKTVDMNSLLSFTISATDPDGDKVTYSATGLPSGAQLNATTGKFTWTPNTVGKYSVKFIATANGQTDNETILINVTSINRPPVLASIGNKTVDMNSLLSFTISATDPDGDKVTYSATGLPSGAQLNATTGKFTWTPNTVGKYSVKFIASANGQTDDETISITVTAVSNTVSYTPSYDNRLRADSPSTVLSTSTYIDIGKSTASSRDVMVFDLSAYNTMDTISKATLSLYWYYPAGATRSSDTVVEIYRPVEWDPKYVSWNYRTSGTLWSTAGGNWFDKNTISQGSTPYASLTFPAATVPGNKYYDFDVTQLVQDYVSGKYMNTGFFLKAKTESGNYIAFYSSKWSNAAQRPKLTVTAASSASSSVDNPPVANAGADKTATTGSVVNFDASASTDDKGIASYSWDFDASNGITSEATGVTATHTYTTVGTYNVTLTVTDTGGQKSTDTLQVVVSSSVDNPPVANAGADKTATTGSVVNFDASASTDDKGIASYSWDFDASNGITSDATGVTAAHTYTTAGTYNVTLTVTDTSGQKSTDTLRVIVSSSSTNTVSYMPTYDNRLRADSPSTVLSASTYIDIGKSTAISRDVMLFDLSTYKTTDIISKATLSLYWYYPTTSRTYDTIVEIYRPVEWNSKYVSWNYRISGTRWTTAGGNWFDKNAVSQGSTPYASLTFAGSKVADNKYYEFDVTQLVQEYVSGKYKNTGFLLKAKTENGNYIAFYSSEWSNSAQRPKLTVTL